MSFCDDCGNLLVPKRKGKKKVLFCRVCGTDSPLEVREQEYRIGHRREPEAKRTKVIVEETVKRKISPEDREAFEDYFQASEDIGGES